MKQRMVINVNFCFIKNFCFIMIMLILMVIQLITLLGLLSVDERFVALDSGFLSHFATKICFILGSVLRAAGQAMSGKVCQLFEFSNFRIFT